MEGRPSSLPLVGREAEFARLRAFLDLTRSGNEPRHVVLEGESGIGKTRVAHELREEATSAGFASFLGVGAELQIDRPFGVLIDALEAHHTSPDHDRRAIGELLLEAPNLNAVVNDHRYRVIEAIEDALEREAMRHPILLIVDDAQWADRSSILALDALTRRSDIPLLLILSCRPAPRSQELGLLLNGVVEAGGCHLKLARLTEPAIVEIARRRLGANPGPSLSRQLGRAGGNPLFALELLDGLAEEHVITILQGTAEAASSAEPPPSLRALVMRRLGALGPASLDLLHTAAVLGESFSCNELALVTSSSLSNVLALLEEPIRSGFISADGDAFVFRHDVVREALYDDLPLAVRKALHLEVGRTLAAAGAPRAVVARHLAVGAQAGDREAIGWLRDAALEVAPNSPGVAADLLRRAADLLPPRDPERLSLLMPAVRQLALVGRVGEASAVAEDLMDLVEGSPVRVVLDLERVSLLIEELRFEEVRAHLIELLDDASQPEAFHMQFLAMHAGTYLVHGDMRHAAERIEEVRPFAAANPASPAAALLRWYDAVRCWMRGDFLSSVEHFEQALPGTELFIGGRDQGLIMLAAGQCLGADRFGEAVATLETARTGLEQRGMLAYLIEYHWFLATVHFVRGTWDDALAEMAASRELSGRVGALGIGMLVVPDPTPLIHLFRSETDEAQTAFSLGDADEALAASALVAAWREPIRAAIQHALGNTAAALRTLRSWHSATTEGDHVPDFRTTGRTSVDIARAAGDKDLLRQMLMSATTAFDRARGLKSVEAAALLVQGAITDDPDRLAAAAAASRAAARPFDLAESCAEAGLSYLRRGDRDRGRDLVMQAFDLYDDLGVRWQAAALAQSIRQYGVRRGSRNRRTAPDHGWDSLTESERRVVALLAEGLTNGEIGLRLFISKGTVATHLRSVFRKVGVSSRTELAAQAARRLT